MRRILVVDDDRGFRTSLVETLRSLGHIVAEADSAKSALAAVASMEDLGAVILDYRLANESGLDVLRALRERYGVRLPPVLMLTAYADAHGTIEAMRLGAFDHITKPIGRGQIEAFLAKALSTRSRAGLNVTEVVKQPLIGVSQAIREVQKAIGRAAASNANVLITGETGTGKEVAARVLHEFSSRSTGPFVAVNCAAIPADLLESELFGHAKGAFTGASVARPGCFEQAQGGTLMLDEIGDMPVAMQAKILRVLQERRVTRLGETNERELDVRIVAASHRDLDHMVECGEFRRDLYFRLNVLPIHMPPLRERREDIVPLASFFLQRSEGRARSLSSSACAMLEALPWPGNVRELQNAMERACVMVPSDVIDANDLEFLISKDASAAQPAGVSAAPAGEMRNSLETLERELIESALAQSSGNRSDAARRLGISRAQLYRRLRALGIEDRVR